MNYSAEDQENSYLSVFPAINQRTLHYIRKLLRLRRVSKNILQLLDLCHSMHSGLVLPPVFVCQVT